MDVDVRVLGPMEIVGRGMGTPQRPAQRRLLGLLLLEAGRVVNRDRLIDQLWEDNPPATARNTLQAHVSGLRQHVGDLVQTVGDAYRAAVAPRDVDAVRFGDLVAQARACARRQAWEPALVHVEAAEQTWQGPPWMDLASLRAARPEIVRLQALRDELDLLRCRALIGTGRATDAVADVERLAAARPLDESVWECLMVARARAGRPADGAAAFLQAHAALGEIGWQPGPRLRKLHANLLVGSAGT